MEAQLSYLILITLFLITLLHAFRKQGNASRKLPPGPTKLPIIGNLHQLAVAGSLPHRYFQQLSKKHGPLIHLKLGQVDAFVVSSATLAKDITKTHDLAFVNRPNLVSNQTFLYGPSDISFAPYGDSWRELRKICTMELLGAKSVHSLSSVREEESARFVESIRASAGSPVDLSGMISSLISGYVYRAAFGDNCEGHHEFMSLNKRAIAMCTGFHLHDFFPSIKPLYSLTGMRSKVLKLHKELDHILDNIILHHQRNQQMAHHDLVHVLLSLQRSNSLHVNITLDNIKAVILNIFGAGTDTTASTIEWAMSEIIKDVRVRDKVQTELRQAFRGKKTICESDLEQLNYLKLVVKETLRLHAPTPLLIPRECINSTEIGGYEIPSKARVMVNVWAIARDAQYWHDPERFIPERFENTCIDFKGNNFEYLPFGGGRRICPGITFGLATIMLPLALLLYHFNWELPNGIKPQDLDMTELYALAIQRKNSLCLIPSVYDSSLI